MFKRDTVNTLGGRTHERSCDDSVVRCTSRGVRRRDRLVDKGITLNQEKLGRRKGRSRQYRRGSGQKQRSTERNREKGARKVPRTPIKGVPSRITLPQRNIATAKT